MKKKEVQETKYDIDEYRKKQKWKKRKAAFFSAFTFFLLTAAVIGGLYLYRNYDMDQLMDLWSKKSENGSISQGSFPISVDGISPQRILSSEKAVILLTKDEVAVVSPEGEVLHNFTHQYTNAVVKASGNRLLTYDKGGYGYRVDNYSDLLYDAKFSKSILTGEIAGDGSYAIVTGETNYAGSVTVFGKNNQELLKWYSASDQIVDLSFSMDSKYLAVGCVGFQDGNLMAKVYLLSVYDGEEVEKAVVSFAGALPLDVSYTEEGAVHLVCDNKIVVINKDFSASSQISLEGQVVSCHTSQYRTLAVLESAGQVAHTILEVSGNGEQHSTQVNGDIFDLADSEFKVYLLVKNNIYVFDAGLQKNGEIPLDNDVFDITSVKESIYVLDSLKFDRLAE